MCLSNLGDVNLYQLGNLTKITTEDNGPETISFFLSFFFLRQFSKIIACSLQVLWKAQLLKEEAQREVDLGKCTPRLLSLPSLSECSGLSSETPSAPPALFQLWLSLESDSVSHTPSPCVCISHQTYTSRVPGCQ